MFDHSLEYSAMYWLTHADWVIDASPTIPATGSSTWWRWHAIREPHLEWLFKESGLSTEPIDSGWSRGSPVTRIAWTRWRGTLEPDRQRRMEEYCFDRMRAPGYEP